MEQRALEQQDHPAQPVPERPELGPQSSPATLSGEIGKILEQISLPGLSLPALIEGRRKDIEALAEANRIALAGAQELAARQREILQQTVRELQALVLQGKAPEGGAALPAQFGDLVRKSLQDTLGNMRALAELAAKSQTEAFEVVGARVRRSLEELRAQLPHPK